MNWKLFISLRYLTQTSKERFISMISVISVFGVIVGVAALIVVISIMTGFDIEIKEKIIGTYSHIVLLREGGIENEEDTMRVLGKNKHVVASAPFIDEPAFIKYETGVVGILLRGLDEKRESTVSNVKEYVDGGALNFGENGIILGSELAKALRLKKGDEVTVFSPYPNKEFPYDRNRGKFTMVGTFVSGRYDYDANLAFVSLESAKALFGKNSVSGIGIRVDDEFNVKKIKHSLQSTFGYPFTIKSWMDLDKNLMRALAIEKKMMFIILALIILVACFNIASSLIMQVLEKTKDIGILRAIGATAGSIRMIFIFLGFMTGLLGAFLGSCCGIFIAGNINVIADQIEKITGFSLFPSDIYYLSEIPSKIVPGDIAFIAVFALFLAVLASLYPAWKASRLNPVEAIRYE
ncbi:MAG: lipoprotein-releasing ABC transporter permease subunit [Candidatus Omnitrophica bacterium]|nr:lipoprotein-releasing ABC transporter permease subunit [Candidatus Omnitrophota bacterium]